MHKFNPHLGDLLQKYGLEESACLGGPVNATTTRALWFVVEREHAAPLELESNATALIAFRGACDQLTFLGCRLRRDVTPGPIRFVTADDIDVGEHIFIVAIDEGVEPMRPHALRATYSIPSRIEPLSRGLPARPLCRAATSQVQALTPAVRRLIEVLRPYTLNACTSNGSECTAEQNRLVRNRFNEANARHLVFHDQHTPTRVVPMILPDAMRERVIDFAQSVRAIPAEESTEERARRREHGGERMEKRRALTPTVL